MSGRASARTGARLWCAAALGAMAASPACAQTAPPPAEPTELDPSAPMAPMPDLGVQWPDLKTREPSPPAASTPAPAAPIPTSANDGTSERKYVVEVEGLTGVGDVETLLKSFRDQSALEADRKRPANVAQIDRRSRADADLLEELLRSQGFYDADVVPRTEAAG